MDTPGRLLSELQRLFPPVVVLEPAAPHKCLECDTLSKGLANRPWTEVPEKFVGENPDVLPLFSEDAYVAYLPAWLREGLLRPDEGTAGMVLVNLHSSPPVARFTPEQAQLIVEVAKEICSRSVWPPDDPVTLESLEAIARIWTA